MLLGLRGSGEGPLETSLLEAAFLLPTECFEHLPQSSLVQPVRSPAATSAEVVSTVQECQPEETSLAVRGRVCEIGGDETGSKQVATSGHPVLSLERVNQRLGYSILGEAGAKWAFRTFVPVSFLSRVATTEAFISWLEALAALAQILSLAMVSRTLSGDIVCLVDNCASEHTLRKATRRTPDLPTC